MNADKTCVFNRRSSAANSFSAFLRILLEAEFHNLPYSPYYFGHTTPDPDSSISLLWRQHNFYLSLVVTRAVAFTAIDYNHAVPGVYGHRNREDIFHLPLQRFAGDAPR